MASRHSTGVTYSLARNSCLNTSMWSEWTICGRWAEFPRASARRCLTFPHGVYSAHRFSSRSFSSPTWCTGFADSPPVDGKLLMQLLYHGELPTPPRFRFHGCDPISHCTGTNSRFRWTLQYIFVYTAGPVTFEFASDKRLLAACQARWREKKFSHFIELWNRISITEPTTSTQAQTRFARMGVGTLNQSTSRDGLLARDGLLQPRRITRRDGLLADDGLLAETAY